MYVKFLFPLLVIFCFSTKNYSQSNSFLNCNLIKESIENKEFNKYFKVDKFPKKDFNIVDTSNFFKNCYIGDIYNRKINIINNIESGKNLIYVYCIKKIKNKTTLQYFDPTSNILLTIELTEKRKCIKVKVVDLGIF
jgi:hypothetical protein